MHIYIYIMYILCIYYVYVMYILCIYYVYIMYIHMHSLSTYVDVYILCIYIHILYLHMYIIDIYIYVYIYICMYICIYIIYMHNICSIQFFTKGYTNVVLRATCFERCSALALVMGRQAVDVVYRLGDPWMDRCG